MSSKKDHINKALQVLIVEDEPHAQKELIRLLDNSPFDMVLMDCIDTVSDAITYINDHQEIDLMFFDIQLADGLSFEIFQHIESKTPVIFTTAFDEYAIQAFKVNSIDYLLKPVKQKELNAALDKYLSGHRQESKTPSLNLEQIESLLAIKSQSYKTRFISRLGDQILHIDVADVSYFKAEDNTVLLVSKDNKEYFVDYALEELSSLLDPDAFFRLNRSFIAHISAIDTINKYFNSRLLIKLDPPTEEKVLVSRVKVNQFLEWIDQ